MAQMRRRRPRRARASCYGTAPGCARPRRSPTVTGAAVLRRMHPADRAPPPAPDLDLAGGGARPARCILAKRRSTAASTTPVTVRVGVGLRLGLAQPGTAP